MSAEPAEPPETTMRAPSGPARPIAVVAAPWIHLLCPGRAARVLAAGSARAFAASYAAGIVLLAVSMVGLGWWDATYTYEWQQPTTFPTATATAPGTAAWWGPGEWRSRTLAQVWQDWHSGGTPWWGPAETTFTLTIVLGTLAAAGLAWLQLPRVHRTGSVKAAYGRSLRAVSAAFGVVTVGISVVRTGFILDEHELWLTRAVDIDTELVGMLGVLSALWLGVGWLNSAVTAVEVQHVDLTLPPRCEGCGYDLTHRPADGRCTECGREVAASLTAERDRPGSDWMRRPWLDSWLTTTLAVLFEPSRFYRGLKLRSAGSTERGFAGWNLLLIALGTFGWMCSMFLLLVPFTPPDMDAEMLCAFAGFALGAALGCWFGYRVIAAGVASWWLARSALPDSRWAAKVIAYESAFLWAFCCYWGVLASSFMLAEDWLTQALGWRSGWLPLGMPVEAAVVMLGTIALGLLWLWRYRVARRAIQWSNF